MKEEQVKEAGKNNNQNPESDEIANYMLFLDKDL